MHVSWKDDTASNSLQANKSNGNFLVDLDELLSTLMAEFEIAMDGQREEMQSLFKILDRNRDGTITLDEFQGAIQKMMPCAFCSISCAICLLLISGSHICASHAAEEDYANVQEGS